MNKIYPSIRLSPNKIQPDAEEVQPSDSIDYYSQIAYTYASDKSFPIVHVDGTLAAWMKSPLDDGPEILPGFNVPAPMSLLFERHSYHILIYLGFSFVTTTHPSRTTKSKPRQPNSPQATSCGSTSHKLEAQGIVKPESSTWAPADDKVFGRSGEA
ncbi:hypothetical protein Moror_8347 [Moniliophthora roreri MCA 2997]|uniref:Uncharacterized protein n=2 Tax=Moniliophthora roreri TaxID=221103 RepID=V2XKA7_MONRO|nr:hypothetical protein Moror_8347 [Moniliophthora roreri MCA 2997]